MIRPTVLQSIRTSLVIVVLSVLVASHATSPSKSRVNPERCRANGTPSTLTPCCGHCSRLSWARTSRRQTRGRDGARSIDGLLVVAVRRGEPTQRAQPAPQRHPHHHQVTEELHLPHPDPIETGQARECPADAHVALLCKPLDLQTASSLPDEGGGPSPHPDRVSPASMPASDDLSPRPLHHKHRTATATTCRPRLKPQTPCSHAHLTETRPTSMPGAPEMRDGTIMQSAPATSCTRLTPSPATSGAAQRIVRPGLGSAYSRTSRPRRSRSSIRFSAVVNAGLSASRLVAERGEVVAWPRLALCRRRTPAARPLCRRHRSDRQLVSRSQLGTRTATHTVPSADVRVLRGEKETG